jgi:hypothetical protein
MANNPYSPPTADVSEQNGLPEPDGARPRTVYIGSGILAVLGAYSLLGLFNYNFAARLEALTGQSPFLLTFVFLPATMLFVQIIAIVFAFLRRKWARITLVVLLAWGILGATAGAYSFFTLRRGTWPGLVDIFLFTWTVLAVRAVGLGLLFTPSANAWFRAHGAR